MPDGEAPLAFAVETGIRKITDDDWDRCAGTANPFVRHAFLAALEDSGSAGHRTGWQPAHLVARDGLGRICGVAPMYVKSHSYGEYVFDHGWAHAFERAGGRYYPKLQACIPFTPVPGPRLLTAPDAPTGTATGLAAAMRDICTGNDLSSAHVTFCDGDDRKALTGDGWLERQGLQYHWHNDGYASFDDFLGRMSSRKRKQIRRERSTVAESGLAVHVLTGSTLSPAHWDAFHSLYVRTADRKWGRGYLNRRFFHQLGATMADAVVLVMAEDRGEWVAGALNLLGEDTLYGRNWGAEGDYPFLHFEACYYRAIDFAIERGLARVEAGAQGEHKLQRGYRPTVTYSAHWISDTGLRRAVSHFLKEESRVIGIKKQELENMLPFRCERAIAP